MKKAFLLISALMVVAMLASCAARLRQRRLPPNRPQRRPQRNPPQRRPQPSRWTSPPS